MPEVLVNEMIRSQRFAQNGSRFGYTISSWEQVFMTALCTLQIQSLAGLLLERTCFMFILTELRARKSTFLKWPVVL